MRFKVILFLLVLTLVSECKSCSLSDQLWHYQVELLPTLNLSSPISSVLLQSRVLIPEEAIHRCYDGRLDQQLKVDIFKPNITIFQLVFNYYVYHQWLGSLNYLTALILQKSFPEKRVTLHSIQSLVESAKEIAQHVTDCVHSGKRYQLGFTSMADQVSASHIFSNLNGLISTDTRRVCRIHGICAHWATIRTCSGPWAGVERTNGQLVLSTRFVPCSSGTELA